MGRKYKIRDQEGLYFVTFTVVYWLDLFIRDDYKQIVVDSLNYCRDKKGLQVYAWVIMTSHVHLILRSNENLSDTIRDMKSHTPLALVYSGAVTSADFENNY
jgi:REP element-mobilizing transposase RayT